MDPLFLEALRFGTAFLAGGLVAVASALLTFRYAQRLQRAGDARADAALRRALVAEIRENMRRLRGVDWTALPSVVIVRTAWDGARALQLPAAAFDAIAAGHSAATRSHELASLVVQTVSSGGIVSSRESLAGAVRGATDAAKVQTIDACAFFARALEELGEPGEPAERTSTGGGE